ncbi:Frd dihydrofolate reductase [Aeromonas phage phiAS5]|uniref:dihydrofolate reductase n=1 Tax=Aeromonas phage phiAS5 TaxID=879630 RepID=E1A2K2_9CAUD|nr:dihydrofolate reductase [Aeromonas phage phiAS5]ADM79948.1 Frd dihydrofolate reductase [Aeromonas phage phiAS5]
MIKAVFATGKNGEFGNKGELPWGHCKEDMKHFMKTTAGACLVMGAKTFMSLPSALKNRTNVVISSQNDTNRVIAKNGDRPDMFMHGDVCQALDELRNTYDNICVIGGMTVLKEAIDKCDEVAHTVILNDDEFECDVRADEEFTNKLMTDFWVYDMTYLEDVAIAYKLMRNKNVV